MIEIISELETSTYNSLVFQQVYYKDAWAEELVLVV